MTVSGVQESDWIAPIGWMKKKERNVPLVVKFMENHSKSLFFSCFMHSLGKQLVCSYLATKMWYWCYWPYCCTLIGIAVSPLLTSKWLPRNPFYTVKCKILYLEYWYIIYYTNQLNGLSVRTYEQRISSPFF